MDKDQVMCSLCIQCRKTNKIVRQLILVVFFNNIRKRLNQYILLNSNQHIFGSSQLHVSTIPVHRQAVMRKQIVTQFIALTILSLEKILTPKTKLYCIFYLNFLTTSKTSTLQLVPTSLISLSNSELRHPPCVFKLYGEVNSVKSTAINIWLNDGVYWQQKTTCFGLQKPSSGFENFLAKRVLYNMSKLRGDVEISSSQEH